MVPGLLHTSFYDSLGLFEHILTDFEISRFLHTPIPPLSLPSLDRCKIAEMSLEFRDFVKISPNFDDYLETLEGACTGVQKSRKSKIAKNELKHTQTITEVHLTGFYARYDALMYRVMYPRNGIKLNNLRRPGPILQCSRSEVTWSLFNFDGFGDF